MLEFGSASRFAAKWAAAVRVLVDTDSSGARFIDVRLPERPAAAASAPGPDPSAEGAAPAAEDTSAASGAATAGSATDSGATGPAQSEPVIDPNTQP